MTFCMLGYVCEKEGGADLCVYMRTKCLFACCLFSRKRTKIRKKTKYTILDNIDEQERMELRPKYGMCYMAAIVSELIPVGRRSPEAGLHFGNGRDKQTVKWLGENQLISLIRP